MVSTLLIEIAFEHLYWQLSSSKGCSNSSTCNLLSSRTFLIWLEIVWLVKPYLTVLAYMIWFCLYSSFLNYSWKYKHQKPREKGNVMLKLQFTLISQNKLFISMQSLPFSRKQVVSVFSRLPSLRVVLSFLFLKKNY